MAQTFDRSTDYLNLTNEALTTLLEAQSAWTTRALRYAKASFDIVTKPYAMAANPAAVINENVERANSLVALSKEEMRASGSAVVELGDKLIEHTNTWQETVAQGADEIHKALLSNLDAIKERTEQQADRFSQGQATSRNGATASSVHGRAHTAAARRKHSRKA